MTIDSLLERIDQGEVIILDGGTASELIRQGVPKHTEEWCAAALSNPQVVRQVHEDYIHAGADIIITNTFGTARHALERTKMADRIEELNTRSVMLAKEAREAAAGNRQIYIAGSMSTAFRPEEPSTEYMKASYHEQARLLADGGVDLIMLEMMMDVDQAALAIEAAVSTGLPVWVGYSCKTGDDDCQVALLQSRGETFAEALDLLMPIGGSLVSVMHSKVEDTKPALGVVQERWSGPIGAYPEALRNVISPDSLLSQAKEWVQMGVQLIGGCCGTSPEHIRVLKDGLPNSIPTV